MAQVAVKEKEVATVELTEREVEVLDLLVQGLKNREISQRLTPPVGQRTAEAHVAALLRKTGCRNRAELIAAKLGGSFVFTVKQ